MHTVGDSRADLFDCFYFNLNGDGKFVGVVLIGFGRIEDWLVIIRLVQEMQAADLKETERVIFINRSVDLCAISIFIRVCEM